MWTVTTAAAGYSHLFQQGYLHFAHDKSIVDITFEVGHLQVVRCTIPVFAGFTEVM